MNNTLILNSPFSIKRRLSLKLRFSLKLFWIISLISIFVILIFYIFQINEMTKNGYLTETYEQKISQLSKENKVLEIASSQVGSLDNLENKIRKLNYEKIGKIYYIEVLENQIVTK
jgi:hypothetical protein